MNAISKLRKAEPAPAPSAASILAEIEVKKAEVKRLTQKQYDLAPKTINDDAAEAEYQQVMRDTVEVHRDIERLQVALSNVQNRAAVEATSEKKQLRRGQLAEFEAVLNRRLAAVVNLSKAIEAASKAYATFIGETGKLAECLPDGASLPAGGLLNFEYQVGGVSLPVGAPIAIAVELYRTAETPELRLPGAKPLTSQLALTPQAIEPLAPALQRTNDLILGTVRGQVSRAEAAATKALA